MCLYPKFIKNRKYIPNKKNKGNVPTPTDQRVLYVPVGCGKCIECLQQKARQWRIRLSEQLKQNKLALFVTLTFSNEQLELLMNENNMDECNAIAGKAVRRFLERWRKKNKKSLKHWFITELGHENTERIHLHGIIFADTEIDTKALEKTWKYGNIYVGDYCNLRTINYIIKYVHKIDTDHKGFYGQIFCSAGLGSNYLKDRRNLRKHTFDGNTIEFYTHNDGSRSNLPIYYRNNLWTEEQREQLWLQKLDQHSIYVLGTKIDRIDTEEGRRRYNEVLKTAQEKNTRLGYGDRRQEWKKKPYNVTLRMLNKEEKAK